MFTLKFYSNLPNKHLEEWQNTLPVVTSVSGSGKRKRKQSSNKLQYFHYDNILLSNKGNCVSLISRQQSYIYSVFISSQSIWFESKLESRDYLNLLFVTCKIYTCI